MIFSCLLALALGAGVSSAQSRQPSATERSTSTSDSSPSGALAEILVAACRHDVRAFSAFLTPANAAAFGKLDAPQQIALLRRLVQLEDSGQPLLSTDASGRTVLRCDTPSIAAEIRLGDARDEENFSFVPIDLNHQRHIEFGLLRTSSGWKLFSLGLLVLDVTQLSAAWQQQDLEAREQSAVDALKAIAQALDTYEQAFHKLPDSLLQLGPPGREGISEDHAGLLDPPLDHGEVTGYAIRYRMLPTSSLDKPPVYELAATPQQYGKTGVRSFFLDSTGKLRGGDKHGSPATIADPVIPAAQP